MAVAVAGVSAPPVTPPTYHRIVSPTLKIPSDPLKPIPIGLLACQRDPLLRDLTTTAVSSRASQSTAVPSNGREGKRKKAATVPTAALLEVILHDTVIFPEGGGQPSDIGILTSADGELWDVVEAKRHGGHAVHYVRLKPEQNVDDALSVFSTGAVVIVSLGEEGSKRRLDHGCMHTSQHLLSAVLENKLDVQTLAWSLTAWPTPSYVEIARNLSAQEIAFVQEEANKLVFEGRSVHVEVEELDPSAGRVYSGPSVSIPEDYTGGVKRTIVIDGVDRNPCCGTHAPSLHNLQLFILPNTETLARSAVSSVRLYFLSGPRLIAHLTSAHTLLSTTAGIMSCGAPQVPERVQQVVDERKKATKRVEDLEAELAASIAAQLVAAGSSKAKLSDTAAGSAAIVLHEHRVDDSTNALAFLSSITQAFAGRLGEREGPASPFLIVLSSSPSAQTTTSTTVVLIFGSNDKKVKEAGDELKAKLSVKGGGKGLRWSGKYTGVWKDTREGAIVESVLKTLQL